MSHEYASENARLLATIPELMDVLRGFRRLLIEQGDDLAITTGAPEEFARLDRDYKKALKYIKG